MFKHGAQCFTRFDASNADDRQILSAYFRDFCEDIERAISAPPTSYIQHVEDAIEDMANRRYTGTDVNPRGVMHVCLR